MDRQGIIYIPILIACTYLNGECIANVKTFADLMCAHFQPGFFLYNTMFIDWLMKLSFHAFKRVNGNLIRVFYSMIVVI